MGDTFHAGISTWRKFEPRSMGEQVTSLIVACSENVFGGFCSFFSFFVLVLKAFSHFYLVTEMEHKRGGACATPIQK